MASDQDGQNLSPEALRQLRVGIDAAAARIPGIGSRPSAPRATVVSQAGMLANSFAAVAGFQLGSDQLAKVLKEAGPHLANVTSVSAVGAAALQTISASVQQIQKEGEQRKAQQVAAGPRAAANDKAGEGGSPTGESRIQRQMREGTFIPGGVGSRTASCERAGMSPSANARGFTAADYNSPLGRAIMNMGVNGTTYDYLRKEGFDRKNIYSAAKDADALGFSVNDKRMVKNHATIRQKGNDPDKTNHIIQTFSKGLDKNPEFKDAALKLKNAKTEEERKAAWAEIKKVSDQQAKKDGLTDNMAKQRDEAVKKAIGEIKDKKVEDKVKAIHEATPDPGTAAEREKTPTTGVDADALLKAAEAKLAAAKPEAPKSPPVTASAPKPNPDSPQSAPPVAPPRAAAAAAPAPKQ